jgi:hypothetical protein
VPASQVIFELVYFFKKEKKIRSWVPAFFARWFCITSLLVGLVADGWCWFVLREKYSWLVAGG